MTASIPLVDAIAGAPGARVALVAEDARWTGADLMSAAARLAGGLAGRGIGLGDRVAFEAPLTAETVVLFRACWHLGAVAVPLHPQLGARRQSEVLERVAPRLAVTAGGPGPVARFEAVATGSQEWIDLIAAEPTPAVDGPADQPGLTMFTSGSTGGPKGVVHTQESLAAKALQSLDVHDLGPGDAVLVPAPLAHVSGLLHGVLIPAVGGVTAVLMDQWEPGAALDLIEQERITYMVGPPTFFIDLMDHPSFTPDRVASLRFLSCGGTGVTPAFAERAAGELGCLVKRSYGSTEAPTVTTSRNDDPVERMVGTDGRAHGATELRIADLPPGADGEGEVRVKGPEVAVGYLDADTTAAAFTDGWFRTGDIGRLEDGWLTITGRSGDRIIRGGENIATHEVERVLEAHPAVGQAVAVGLADERLGERVGAVVIGPTDFDLDTCRRWFAAQGASPLLVPERLLLVDRIPTLPSGKPDRVEITTLLDRAPAAE